MKFNLFKRYFMFAAMIVSFAMLPVACSSDDPEEPTVPEVVDPVDPVDPEVPAAVADPTNENTTITATGATLVEDVSTSTVTVQLASADGKKLTKSGGPVVVTTTGSAVVGETVDNGDGTYTIVITNAEEQNVTVSATINAVAITNTASITFNPDNSNPAQEIAQSTVALGPSIIAINSGGPEVVYDDITFLADQFFDVENTKAYKNPFVNAIAGTEMDSIYVTERITGDTVDINGPFSYNIPVTNGMYSVKLYFAEIYWGLENPEGFPINEFEGKRIFNATIEDVVVFAGYDLVRDVQPAIADQRMYDVEVTDGMLTITFEASVNKPKISAIEVLGTGALVPADGM